MRAVALFFIGVMLFCETVHAGNTEGIGEFYASLDDALLDMGMTTADFRIRHDYARPDVFRLPMVDSLMHNPARLPAVMDRLAWRVEESPSLSACAGTLWEAMSVEPDESGEDPEAFPAVGDIAGRLAHLRPPFGAALEGYLRSLKKMSGLYDAAIAEVAPQLDYVKQNLPALLAPDEEYEGIDPFELHRLEKEEEALNDSVLMILEGIEITAVASMSSEALRAAEDIEDRLAAAHSLTEGMGRWRGRRFGLPGKEVTVTGSVLYLGLSPWGPVAVGDTTSTVYEGCFALIIDPGGDDIYNLTDEPDVHFRMILDASGDDAYRSRDAAGVGGAIMGTSIIVDLAGTDSYRSPDISLGSGICGLGVIDDREGNDTYTSGVFSQGAAFLGLGILRDGAGNDTYVAGMQSQAFGYVMGTGLLWERGGNDTYHTRMSQTDILRYDDHYLTLSQGCAFGSRPDYSGGIGLLVDSWGNDIYSSDIFGQGVAYWFAVGALIDRGGHDRYCSYQYAQGAGIHLAFGLLLDGSGDDGYISKGVSQGCGHDLSFGLLADLSGNDWYTATDLSQGAGNANGTGVIYDADGKDVYASKDERNVNGYGNYRREFGSIGLHIDMRGEDFYSARGRNDSIWESGMYGLGIDTPMEAKSPAGDIVVKRLPLESRDFTSEDLFILSSRGEPRFNEWRQYAFDKMVEDTAGTIEYMRTVLDTKDARERHTIKDILRKIGKPAVPMLAEAVIEDSPRAKSEASWILGLIGRREAFGPLLEMTRAQEWHQRSSALNAIGKLDSLSDDDLDRLRSRIREVLTDDSEVIYVRKDAAYACGRQAVCSLLDLRAETLDDPHYAVRFAAAEAIKQLSASGCEDAGEVLSARVREMDGIGVVAALHAAGGLPHSEKLRIAEVLEESRQRLDPHEEIALAGLLGGVEPETSLDRERLEALMLTLPQDSWKVRAALGR
jgi:HEAT repeat protein